MIGRRRASVALALIGVLVVLAGLVLSRLPGPAPSPTSAPTTSHPPSTPRPDDATVRAFPGTPLLPGPPVESIGRPTQSRLWAIDGTWYGIVIDPGTREARIGVLEADGSRWSDSGVLVDERPGSMVDALWDGQRLVTISAVPGRSTDDGVRINRFRRDDDGRLVRDPNYPVALTERGVTAATIARDGSGRLWAAFVQEGRVLVAHATTDDAIWAPPVILPGSGPVGDEDLAAVLATGDGRVAVVWSDTPASAVRAVLRDDDDAFERWGEPEVASADLPLARRSISAAAAEGTIAVGIQTEIGAQPGTSDPDSVVAIRDPEGPWRSALTSRVSDRLGTPVVVLDPAGGYVYAFLTSPRRAGQVYLKRSPLDRLDFPAGRGLLVIDDPSSPPEIESISSAKSPLALADTFVITGLDESSGIPWHALVGPPQSSPGPSSSPATPAPSSAPSPTQEARLLVEDDFAPWPEGTTIGSGWELGPADAEGTLVADGGSPDDRHAALRSATEAAVRACKAFPTVTAGDLVIDVTVRADAIGDADVVITSIRSGSAESASVRFGQGGTFAYYAGETKVRTTVPNQLDQWLRSRVTVHLGNGTYDWRLTTTDGAVIVAERGIPFREPVDGASSVCIGTSTGPGRPVVRFDDVRVAH